MRLLLLTILTIITSIGLLPAQQYYPPILNVPVEVDGQLLKFPFTGGINTPQPNEVDLNQDGLMDLYVFDREGDVGLTFINQGDSNYQYVPGFARFFPEDISNWVILRDYDNDGIMDLFTHPQKLDVVNGIAVFKGYYENGHIAFERFHFDYNLDIIPITLSNGTQTQLYVSNVDYPAIDDMDCDGDLDVLTFNVAGGQIELYLNRSEEQGYGRDSLIFELTDNCWGGIFETSISPEVILASQPGDCANFGGDTPISVRHPGSTLLTLDIDNDGDKDLILGDITYNSVSLLNNAGTCDQAWINDQDASYPSYDIPVDVPVFPAAFFLDVNGDGAKDLLAAPNAPNGGENKESLLFYENTNTTELPDFEFRQNDFLVDEMLDFGAGSAPAFFDYNADGLLDLVVGSDGFYEPFGERDSRLFLLENVGTLDAPAFRLVDDDYLGLNAFDAFYAFTPTFGDLDGDGDLDILVGEYTGGLFYAENTAGAGNTASFGSWQYSYADINVGLLSAPAIVDLDRDGLPDLIVGERSGNVNFFKNTGTPSEPSFNSDPAAAPNIFALGNINTSQPGFTVGHGSPLVLDQEGTYLLFMGTDINGIEVYTGIEGNYDGIFQLEAEQLGDLRVGTRVRPAIADWDNDGFLELIVGNDRGGLNAFNTDLTPSSTTNTITSSLDHIQLSPNPASDWLNINFGTASDSGELSLYNGIGQRLRSEVWTGNTHQLSVQQLPSGVYFLEFISGARRTVRKIVKE